LESKSSDAMFAENVANAMEFAWTCRISYGKPVDCVPFYLLARDVNCDLEEPVGDGRRRKGDSIILVGAMMMAVVVRKN